MISRRVTNASGLAPAAAANPVIAMTPQRCDEQHCDFELM